MEENREKAIEEMAKDLEKHIDKTIYGVRSSTEIEKCSTYLVNQGWVKLTEDSIVISKEEYQKDFSSQFNKGYEHGSKETAEKFYNFVRHSGRSQIVYENGKEKSFSLVNREELNNFAKQFGVDIEEQR